jgi:hypothetical protein
MEPTAWRMHGDEQRVPGDGGHGPIVKERKVDDFTALYSMEPPPGQPRSTLPEPSGRSLFLSHGPFN